MSDDADAAPRRITPDKSSCFYPPRKPPGDFVEFINLDGETDAFDLTTVREEGVGRRYRDRDGDASYEQGDEFTYSIGRRGDEGRTERTRSTLKQDGDALVVLEDQLVYRIPRDRFVLVFLVYSEPGDPPEPSLARELSHREASLWFMLKEIKPPTPLEPVGLRDPANDPSSRLNWEWKPPETSANLSPAALSDNPPPEIPGPPVILGNPTMNRLSVARRKPA